MYSTPDRNGSPQMHSDQFGAVGHTSPFAFAPQGQGSRYTPATRVPLRVSFLTAFAHSASKNILHVYQSAEPHRVSVGPPARRVLILTDGITYELPDLERQIQRCTAFSRIEEVMVLPTDATCITESGSRPLTDLDHLLQQATPFDFIRTVAALYRVNMSGGSPPLFELDEGQPLAIRVNCRLRQSALPDAIIEGISKDAMQRINSEHARQLKALRSKLDDTRQVQTTELVDMYGERDQFRLRLQQAEAEILRLQRLGREDRDVAKLQLAEMAEDLRRAREEITLLKLVRVGALPSATSIEPNYDPIFGPAERRSLPKQTALTRLESELLDGQRFLAKVRTTNHPHESSNVSTPPFRQDYSELPPARSMSMGAISASTSEASPTPSQRRGNFVL